MLRPSIKLTKRISISTFLDIIMRPCIPTKVTHSIYRSCLIQQVMLSFIKVGTLVGWSDSFIMMMMMMITAMYANVSKITSKT